MGSLTLGHETSHRPETTGVSYVHGLGLHFRSCHRKPPACRIDGKYPRRAKSSSLTTPWRNRSLWWVRKDC